jgi:hypothetical protein
LIRKRKGKKNHKLNQQKVKVKQDKPKQKNELYTLFFLPRYCFLSIYIATEYAFTSSIHYDPPRMAMVAAAIVLHTHTIFECSAASLTVQCVRFQCGRTSSSSACSLFWKDRCQSYRGRKPDSLQTPGPALVVKRRV